jgi:hypothetical protein
MTEAEKARSKFAVTAMKAGYDIEDNYQTINGQPTCDIKAPSIMKTAAFIKANGGKVINSYSMTHDNILRYRVAF